MLYFNYCGTIPSVFKEDLTTIVQETFTILGVTDTERRESSNFPTVSEKLEKKI